MLPSAGSLLAGLASWVAGSLPVAQAAAVQVPSELAALHRDGQTFLTWREVPGTSVRYRVYRAEGPILDAADLERADFLGEVDDRSSRNQGRSLASGAEHAWVIAPGGAELDVDQGLFVHTATASRWRPAFYAVTSVTGNSEERALVPGANTLPRDQGVFEKASPPSPVLQHATADSELWAHWVSDRDTPFQAAMSPWPSRGYNFFFQPGSAPGPHGLVVRLHAAGQSYLQAWPQRFETPNDVDGLALSDLVPYTSWTFWFGSQELLPGTPSASTRVWNYTQQRMLWTIDWMSARLGAATDPERLYVVGGSMGAIGGMYLLGEAPERFAAALLRNGLYDLKANDYRNPALFQRLFGDFQLTLRTRAGLPILDRTNAVFMAKQDPSVEWPVLRTISGRHDETVGWSSAVELMQGLAEVGRPAVHYFDERTHNPNGYWRDLERTLLRRTFQTRRDRPSLRFSDCSLDDDPGQGERLDGDLVGTINGYVDYDPATARATADTLDFDVYVRDQGVLDDAPAPKARARLGPWRTGPFALVPGEPVLYTLREDGKLVDENLLFADAYGRVRTPLAPLATRSRAAHFERGAAAAPVPLFVNRRPMAGDDLQVVLRGRPGARWMLFVRFGSWRTQARVGVFDDSGLADLAVPLPGFLPQGTLVAVGALLGGTPVGPRLVSVQRE